MSEWINGCPDCRKVPCECVEEAAEPPYEDDGMYSVGGLIVDMEDLAAKREAAEPRADVHPLDEALGNVHVVAISLQMMGQHASAVMLAEAHEAIQGYLVKQPDDVCPVTPQDCNAWAAEFEKASKLLTGRGQLREYYKASAAKLRKLSAWLERGRV